MTAIFDETDLNKLTTLEWCIWYQWANDRKGTAEKAAAELAALRAELDKTNKAMAHGAAIRGDKMTTGKETGTILIFDERARQQEAEGWTPEHDDGHKRGELVLAAIAYALATYDESCEVGGMAQNTEAFAWWPWTVDSWKPKDRLSNLVRAGALIAAEIDRLQRLEY